MSRDDEEDADKSDDEEDQASYTKGKNPACDGDCYPLALMRPT